MRHLERRWTSAEEAAVMDAAAEGRTVAESAVAANRSPAAVSQRITRLRGTDPEISDSAWLDFMLTYEYRIPGEVETAMGLLEHATRLLTQVKHAHGIE